MADSTLETRSKPDYRHILVRYAAALGFTATALLVWWISPPLHESPFLLFLAAVIISARFCGFGPGIFSTVLSLVLIDYFALNLDLTLSFSNRDSDRMLVFFIVSVLASSLARQKSQAEVRTERVRRQLAAIVEGSEDAIFSKDVTGIVTSWNRGAERLYGYRAEEMIGQHVSLIVPAEQADEIPRIMERLLRGEHIQNYITQRVRKDGTRLTVYLSLSPIRNGRGRIVGASTIAQDMTAQRRAEEVLRRNEKLAAAGRLAAAIAHEINNPLDVIGNLLYLARKDREKADEYLRIAEKELQRAANIAQQTLGFVRDAASAVPLDVALVLEEVLHLHLRQLNAKRIRVEKQYQKGSEIHGFSGELRQVFSNLITNALDALPEGGSLRLRVEHSREWSVNRRAGVRVAIADNGHGITPQAMAHLFEPFFTTKQDSGTGLGLWLSYSIIEKHGGWIRVRSRTSPGKSGTVFNIFLPEVIEPSKAA